MFKKPRAFDSDDMFINPKPTTAYRFDYNWGFIQRYYSYDDENLNRIRKLIPIFKKEQLFLNTLASRIKYINTLNLELKFLSKRYNWKKFLGVEEVYLRRFEQGIYQIAESIMYLLQFYTRNKKKYAGIKILRFEDIGRFLMDENNCLPQYYTKSINNSALLSIMLFIRHSLVHDYRNIIYKSFKQNPIIEKNNIPLKNRYGVLRRLYLDYLFSQYNSKKPPRGYILFNDPMNYLKINLKLTKQCKVNYDETIISFKTNTLDFINRLTRKEFFILFRDILSILLEEN